MVFSGPRRHRSSAMPNCGSRWRFCGIALNISETRTAAPQHWTGARQGAKHCLSRCGRDHCTLLLGQLSFGANCASAPAVYLLMTGAKLRTGAVMSNTVSLLVGLACWSVVAEAQVVIRNPQNLDVPQAKVNVIYRTTLRVLSEKFRC
jgi:hypothetical protein